jgi:hypothetical protein
MITGKCGGERLEISTGACQAWQAHNRCRSPGARSVDLNVEPQSILRGDEMADRHGIGDPARIQAGADVTARSVAVS